MIAEWSILMEVDLLVGRSGLMHPSLTIDLNSREQEEFYLSILNHKLEVSSVIIARRLDIMLESVLIRRARSQ